MKYFNQCTTLDEVKKLYKTLAKENHPDKGGDTATMQNINNEYAQAIRMVAAGQHMSAEETDKAIFEGEAYREAINKVINLEGITVEAVGGWIWVTGETKQYRHLLNSEPARFFWASKKVAWYFRPPEWKSANRTKMTLDQIRSKYGSQKINQTTYRNYITNQ